MLSTGIYGIETICENCTEPLTCLQSQANVSLSFNVNCLTKDSIHAENVKYKNIIEIDVTIMGCDYVGCIILVRKTTIRDLNIILYRMEYILRTSNIVAPWGDILHGVIKLLIIIPLYHAFASVQ